jgi:hypothetical protein
VLASIQAILNGRNTDSKSHTNRSAGRSLPKVPPERLRGERSLTKSAYPLKTSRSQDIKAIGANLASRNAEPFVFLKQLFQLYPDQHCGFKFFPNHHADVLTWVTWSNQINRVVILRNPFEMYVSFSRVSATGIWVDKHNKAKHRQPRIKFQAESFDKMMRNILNAQKLFKTTAEKRPESTITITYDEIAALEPVRQLAAFLGAASQPTKLEVPLRKQTTERYSELFENFDELASHMRRNYPNICIDKHKL